MKILRAWMGALGVATMLTSLGVHAPATPDTRSSNGPLRAALTDILDQDGYPAVLGAVLDSDGRSAAAAVGINELGTQTKVRPGSQLRVGSSGKTFTAAIVMQLKAEGELALDASVETYLPGVVRHPEVSGADITVRQLLQHTSGLPDMSGDVSANVLEWQHRYISPRASLDLAFTHPVSNAPGAAFSYSNANYILLGLIVEAITGRPYEEALQARIIEPLGLDHTYFPAQGEQEIRGVHPQSYLPFPGQPDYTAFDPSWGHAAGALVSTTKDLTTFFAALAKGDVVPATELAEMRDTIPAVGLWEGAQYGLGLISFDLGCGETAWGHGGDVPGTTSRVAATSDGRAASIVATQNSTSVEAEARLRGFVDEAICAAA